MRTYAQSQSGASLVEYAALVALLALMAAGAIKILGIQASSTFTRISDELEEVNYPEQLEEEPGPTPGK